MADDPAQGERDLVRRCLSGEPFGDTPGATSPWEEFFGRYAPLLAREIGFAVRRHRIPENPELIQDLVQEVHHALLADGAAVLRRFRWDCSLEHYLSVVAVTRASSALRRRAGLRTLDPAALDEAGWRLWLSEEIPDASRLLEKEETREAVRSAVERLPDRDRLLLQLHYWDSLSLDELAPVFSLRKHALSVILSRARRRLRELLKGAICL